MPRDQDKSLANRILTSFCHRAHKASLSRYNVRSKDPERPVQDHHPSSPSSLVYKHHPVDSRVSLVFEPEHNLGRLTILPIPSPFLLQHARTPRKAELHPNTSPSTFSVHEYTVEPQTDQPNIPWHHEVEPSIPQRNQPSRRTTSRGPGLYPFPWRRPGPNSCRDPKAKVRHPIEYKTTCSSSSHHICGAHNRSTGRG